MALCMCGAEVIWKDGPQGDRIPLEAHEVMAGEDRYVEGGDGRLVAVAPDRNVMAYADHRTRCPRR